MGFATETRPLRVTGAAFTARVKWYQHKSCKTRLRCDLIDVDRPACSKFEHTKKYVLTYMFIDEIRKM